VIFFIDEHFTVAVIEDDDIYYFDSYGDIDNKAKKIL
jgi:hypothetical protein